MKNKKLNSVQDWLPFKKILNNGIIILKNNSYLKILKISPINFNLKSELEKQAILNSYKIFLKTCNFNLQILIQSNKKDLSKHISKIKEKNKNQKNEAILNLSEKYIEYITRLNQEKKTNAKSFYIIIKEELKKDSKIDEKTILQNLNENYFKVKDSLSRCGNNIQEIIEKEEIEKIINSFLNYRKITL